MESSFYQDEFPLNELENVENQDENLEEIIDKTPEEDINEEEANESKRLDPNILQEETKTLITLQTKHELLKQDLQDQLKLVKQTIERNIKKIKNIQDAIISSNEKFALEVNSIERIKTDVEDCKELQKEISLMVKTEQQELNSINMDRLKSKLDGCKHNLNLYLNKKLENEKKKKEIAEKKKELEMLLKLKTIKQLKQKIKNIEEQKSALKTNLSNKNEIFKLQQVQNTCKIASNRLTNLKNELENFKKEYEDNKLKINQKFETVQKVKAQNSNYRSVLQDLKSKYDSLLLFKEEQQAKYQMNLEQKQNELKTFTDENQILLKKMKDIIEETNNLYSINLQNSTKRNNLLIEQNNLQHILNEKKKEKETLLKQNEEMKSILELKEEYLRKIRESMEDLKLKVEEAKCKGVEKMEELTVKKQKLKEEFEKDKSRIEKEISNAKSTLEYLLSRRDDYKEESDLLKTNIEVNKIRLNKLRRDANTRNRNLAKLDKELKEFNYTGKQGILKSPENEKSPDEVSSPKKVRFNRDQAQVENEIK